jgi:hypothetical protein
LEQHCQTRVNAGRTYRQAEEHDDGTRGFREYANVPVIPDILIRIRNADKIREPTYTVIYEFPGDKATDSVVTV